MEAEERFSNLLESREPGWRVDNMGMTGFGPDLMIMALESLLSKAEPDLVVLALAFDDFRRVRDRYAGMGFPSPRFELRGRRLTRVPFPAPKPWERSHLVHGLLMALEEAPVREPLDAGEWRINRAILDRFRELSREHRFQPVVLYLAGPWTGSCTGGVRHSSASTERSTGFRPSTSPRRSTRPTPTGSICPRTRIIRRADTRSSRPSLSRC